MLIQKDGSGEGLSIFSCDRCKKRLKREDRKGIYIQEFTLPPKKTYDLCNRCYEAFKRGVEKGVNRRK